MNHYDIYAMNNLKEILKVKALETSQTNIDIDVYIQDFLNKYVSIIDSILNLESTQIKPLVDLLEFLQSKNIEMSIEEITESSGNSFIIIGKDIVIQYYRNSQIKQRIVNIYNDMYTRSNFLFEYEGNTYNLYDYIVNIYLSFEFPDTTNVMNNVIIWQKITPVLKQHKNEIDLAKLERDIRLALYGFHAFGYKHGDVSLDNIGYNGSNYVLYDFDNSAKLSDNPDISMEEMNKDIVSLYKSIKFRIDTGEISRLYN